VNHLYDQVREALSKDAPAVFYSATKAATSRARLVAAELRIDIGGISLEADVRVSVNDVHEKGPEGISGPVTRLQLEWEATTAPRLFPIMTADLYIYPLTATKTPYGPEI
jgi:hypothetical protein